MKALNIYLKNRLASMNTILAKPRHNFNATSFHRLRVEIKKIKSLLELVNYASPEFKKKKTFLPFRVIFKQAGKVREIQIEEAILKKYVSKGLPKDLLKKYSSVLRRKRLAEQKLFFELLSEKETIGNLKKKYEEIAPFFKPLKNKVVKKYFEQVMNEIQEHLHQSPINSEQLHELRILIKRYNYNRKIFSLGSFKGDGLSDVLGDWHDLDVIIVHILRIMETETMEPAEKEQLQKIISKMDTDRAILYNKIIEILSESNKEITQE